VGSRAANLYEFHDTVWGLGQRGNIPVRSFDSHRAISVRPEQKMYVPLHRQKRMPDLDIGSTCPTMQ
jgi:hypothetical protein